MDEKLKIAMKHFNERESESTALILELEKKVEHYEKALNEICRFINYVGEPIEIYNIASKALNKHIESL